MLETRVRNQNQIKIKMMEKYPIVIDNRNGKEKVVTGLVEFCNFDKGVACCFHESCYLLTPCIIDDDGRLHSSMFSIGRMLWGAYPDEEQLKLYNENCLLEIGKIKCIHHPDGSKTYPAN